ncbi:MAG: histone deacetylase [Bryobacteraceae bacterium]|nr:histone deacetylase [Bryobacteraceae bacterium]
MLPFQFVHHPDYDFCLGNHVFESAKYHLTRQQLLQDGFAEEADFLQPGSALDEDLTLVHTREWIRRLRSGLLTREEEKLLEIPYTDQVVRAFWLHAGGSMLAARLALRDGLAYNIGGGFHHAYPGHGEGFCAINDIAVAIRRVQKDGFIRSAMVVDCDVHHGNGTAAIFENDPTVSTFSIHQANNYPDDKPPSTVDVDLDDEVDDEEYLHRLREALLPALALHKPDLIFYVAGADPHWKDQLGGLRLTMDGLMRRDRLVLDAAIRAATPVAIVLAGGYSQDVRDTVNIHCNTARAARDAMALRTSSPVE